MARVCRTFDGYIKPASFNLPVTIKQRTPKKRRKQAMKTQGTKNDTGTKSKPGTKAKPVTKPKRPARRSKRITAKKQPMNAQSKSRKKLGRDVNEAF